jgi:hypothetical protein
VKPWKRQYFQEQNPMDLKDGNVVSYHELENADTGKSLNEIIDTMKTNLKA